jgi:LmbE family N-acetylglucosaminyl deacetylase
MSEPSIEAADQFAAEMDHMALCLWNNLQPHTPGEEGIQDQKIIEAIYESARTEKSVSLAVPREAIRHQNPPCRDELLSLQRSDPVFVPSYGGSMIVPLVKEEEWCLRLSHLPSWSAESMPLSISQGPVLIVAPHPDDETLSVGGLIASLRSSAVDVLVAAVTDGESAYEDSHGLGEIRAREQAAALAYLGVKESNIFRFRLPDSNVASREKALAALLRPLVKRSAHVIAPWHHDFHPDHEACGRVAESLAMECEVTLAFYFFWTWHRGTTELLSGLPLVRFPLTKQLLDLKLQALACHRSQLYRDCGDPVLPEQLLAPTHRRFETFLPSRVQYGS